MTVTPTVQVAVAQRVEELKTILVAVLLRVVNVQSALMRSNRVAVGRTVIVAAPAVVVMITVCLDIVNAASSPVNAKVLDVTVIIIAPMVEAPPVEEVLPYATVVVPVVIATVTA